MARRPVWCKIAAMMDTSPRDSPAPIYRRRPSRLGEEMARAKIERARRMTPEERLRVAIELSDICLLLKRVCADQR